jgi:hypothetical protein
MCLRFVRSDPRTSENLLLYRRFDRVMRFLLFKSNFYEDRVEFDLRVGDPASKKGATNVWTSVDETDQPAISKG